MRKSKTLLIAATLCMVTPLAVACSDDQDTDEARASYSQKVEAQLARESTAKQSESRSSASRSQARELEKLKAENRQFKASLSRESRARAAENSAQRQRSVDPTPATSRTPIAEAPHYRMAITVGIKNLLSLNSNTSAPLTDRNNAQMVYFKHNVKALRPWRHCHPMEKAATATREVIAQAGRAIISELITASKKSITAETEE